MIRIFAETAFLRKPNVIVLKSGLSKKITFINYLSLINFSKKKWIMKTVKTPNVKEGRIIHWKDQFFSEFHSSFRIGIVVFLKYLFADE